MQITSPYYTSSGSLVGLVAPKPHACYLRKVLVTTGFASPRGCQRWGGDFSGSVGGVCGHA